MACTSPPHRSTTTGRGWSRPAEMMINMRRCCHPTLAPPATSGPALSARCDSPRFAPLAGLGGIFIAPACDEGSARPRPSLSLPVSPAGIPRPAPTTSHHHPEHSKLQLPPPAQLPPSARSSPSLSLPGHWTSHGAIATRPPRLDRAELSPPTHPPAQPRRAWTSSSKPAKLSSPPTQARCRIGLHAGRIASPQHHQIFLASQQQLSEARAPAQAPAQAHPPRPRPRPSSGRA